MEQLSIIKDFIDLDEAFHFMDHVILEHAASGWSTVQSSGLRYVNHQWQVGVMFERDLQMKEKHGD